MENQKMTFDRQKWEAKKAEAAATKKKILEIVNQAVKEPLVDLVYVDRIPYSAKFGFSTSSLTVRFTSKDTWIETDRKLYKGKK
jgi:hypothetical protein